LRHLLYGSGRRWEGFRRPDDNLFGRSLLAVRCSPFAGRWTVVTVTKPTAANGDGERRDGDDRYPQSTKKYGDFTAVDDIFLTAVRGRSTASWSYGAGKTTTIRLLAASPSRRADRNRGRSRRRHDGLSAKAMIGYVPDRPYLYES